MSMPNQPTFNGQPRVFPRVTDGAPMDAPTSTGPEVPRGHVPLSHSAPVAARTAAEGPRGLSTRATVWFRYVGYLLTILTCCGLTQACFSSLNGAQSGGEWMLLSAAFQLAVAVIGSAMFANRRAEILHQVRSYVFGYTVFPGTGVAIFMWSASSLSSGSGNDVFVGSLNAALPWLYFLPIVLPAIIFLKSVSGMRVLHRERMEDREAMNLYTRNDGVQR
jgi:hypothetical protein